MSNKRRNIFVKKIHFRIAVLVLILISQETISESVNIQNRIYEEIYSTYENNLIEKGLVNVQEIDPSIMVDLKYADKNNFMGEDVYKDLKRCYLRKKAALKLKKANEYLKIIKPYYRLLIADGFRPRRVQRRMWENVKHTPMQRYIANPKRGSMHNYGIAVDVTISDLYGRRLDMGTPIDHFGALSQPAMEKIFLKKGKLNSKQVRNRRLLRSVMKKAGFSGLSIEWWHFNAFNKNRVRSTYRIVE